MCRPFGSRLNRSWEITSAGRMPFCSRPSCGSKLTFQISPALGSGGAAKDLLHFLRAVVRLFVLESVHRRAFEHPDLILVALPGNRIGLQALERSFDLAPEFLLLILGDGVLDHLTDRPALLLRQIAQGGGQVVLNPHGGGHRATPFASLHPDRILRRSPYACQQKYI